MESVKAVNSTKHFKESEGANSGPHVITDLQSNKALSSDSNIDSETMSQSDLIYETELTNDFEGGKSSLPPGALCLIKTR